MRIIAIEEHFSHASYRQKLGVNEARSYYISSRSEALGHDIAKEIDDLGETRLKHMDAHGIDVQVLSFNAPVAHGFSGSEAIAMAKEINEKQAAAIRTHPTRFAGFAALPVGEPE